ncbi:MAG: iron-containing redox enzyme family protein [Steroidobacteraceae bacterium]|jgi:pyrroloquinoline-quinone synthase|nr:iron-containing redox enzyme family protein [Steroidobacteraceae bacterium]
MDTLLSNEAFAEALAAARKPEHGVLHPFSLAWARGEFSRRQLGQWAVQHYYYVDAIAQQFAALYARLPDLDARRELLDNLLGEEMPGQPGKRHPELCAKFARACGVPDDDIYRAEEKGLILPTTRAMRAWIWELASQRTMAEAFAGIMVALEGQLPTLYPMLVDAMRKMGFDDDQLEFFHVHIENDPGHEASGLSIASRYANTPDLQRKAIAAVRASAQMRYSMLSGMLATFGLRQAA